MRMRSVVATTTDPKERDALVMAHVDLVRSMASRLGRRLPSQVELSELVSVGVLGLIEAANRYQPTLGVPFDAITVRCGDTDTPETSANFRTLWSGPRC